MVGGALISGPVAFLPLAVIRSTCQHVLLVVELSPDLSGVGVEQGRWSDLDVSCSRCPLGGQLLGCSHCRACVVVTLIQLVTWLPR